VLVPVGQGLKGKQLDVVVTKSHIKVGVKGQDPVIDVSGNLCVNDCRRKGGGSGCGCVCVCVCGGGVVGAEGQAAGCGGHQGPHQSGRQGTGTTLMGVVPCALGSDRCACVCLGVCVAWGGEGSWDLIVIKCRIMSMS
jgi:hypothetical protein